MQTVTTAFPFVFVDGKNFGKIADTIANIPSLASDIQRAAEAEHEQNDKDTAAVIASAAQDSVAARLEAEGAKAKLQNFCDALSKAKDDHEAMKAALTAGMKPEVDAKRDSLRAQIAELQAQEAALG